MPKNVCHPHFGEYPEYPRTITLFSSICMLLRTETSYASEDDGLETIPACGNREAVVQ